MKRLLVHLLLIPLLALGCTSAHAADAGASPPDPAPPATTAPATQRGVAHFPHLDVDLPHRQLRVECEAMVVDIPLEFFCVVRGTSDHETVLRTQARPEQVHAGLLMLGLKPGQPVRYSVAADKWLPPEGPLLHITCEFERDGKRRRVPAYRMMRNVRTKEPMPPISWVFVGSRRMEDGTYAANVTGYLVSVVNFELTVIDIPELASSANETLEWELNTDVAPPAGTRVTMIIEPVAAPDAPATQPASARSPATGASEPQGSAPAPLDVVLITMNEDGTLRMNHQQTDIHRVVAEVTAMLNDRPVTVRVTPQPLAPYDQFHQVLDILRKTGATVEVAPAPPAAEPAPAAPDPSIDIDALRQKWQQAVQPHRDALREAAQAHFEVIRALRRRQQALIDEADQLQRLIDQLQRQYQDMTTPTVNQP